MEAVSYLLAHECSLMMRSLEQQLSAVTSLKCAGMFADYGLLLQSLPYVDVRALILKHALPDEAVVEVLRSIQRLQPDLRVLLFCSSNCATLNAPLLISSGVSAILGSDATPFEFETAIRLDSLHFNRWLTPLQVQAALRQRAAPVSEKPLLTEREVEVLLLICGEKTSHEIADHCCLSLRTIEGIRRTLLDKTGARSTAGLVAYAFRNKLFE